MLGCERTGQGLTAHECGSLYSSVYGHDGVGVDIDES
jgi:hypothetical protein